MQIQNNRKSVSVKRSLPGVSVEEPVKVTLHDCLACSGCVTSAETVLLEHQGLEELKQKLNDPSVIVAFSISAQSRASLAAAFNLAPAKVNGISSSVDLLFCCAVAVAFNMLDSCAVLWCLQVNAISVQIDEERKNDTWLLLHIQLVIHE